jgi:hypothetical protein
MNKTKELSVEDVQKLLKKFKFDDSICGDFLGNIFYIDLPLFLFLGSHFELCLVRAFVLGKE